MHTLVSIILPVYNGELTISESIESILSQTYTRFELIIIDDGSYDNSLIQVKRFKDKRIKLYIQKNAGLARTLNYGISVATGELIARQDQDDISMPTRIEEQVQRFINNKKLVLLGTNGIIIDKEDQVIGKLKFPSRSIDLQFLINFYNPFIHTSMMIRAKDLRILGGYSIDPECQPPEDFELWNRIKARGEIENLTNNLVKYRKSENSMSNKSKNIIEGNYKKLVVNNMENIFKLNTNEAELVYNLLYTNSNNIDLKNRIKLFFKLAHKLIRIWFKPNRIGVQSYRYTIVMLGKIIIK